MLFAYPQVLWLILTLPALAFLDLWAEARRRKALALFGDPALMERLSSASPVRRRVRTALGLCGLMFLLLALARPRFGTRLEEVHRKGLDLVVALDVSQSMLTEDIKPSRLAKAKAEVSSLIDRLDGDRIGLVSFAGTAFIQCPLTLDYAAARLFLDLMGPDLIPVPGTDIGRCLETALEAFTRTETKYRVLVLITDGEHHGAFPEEQLQKAVARGVRIYCIGIGRVEGGPIPIRDPTGTIVGHKKNRSDQPVVSQLKVFNLEKIAQASGGRFYQATRGEMELARILEDLGDLERRTFSTRRVEQMEDRYQWFLGAGFLLLIGSLAISERVTRGKVWYGRFV